MLNESLFLLSLDDLKSTLVHDLTVSDVALTYILLYVVYKALGRYIYFKPQEHTSKINRTFLVLSLLVVSLHFLGGITSQLPFLSEHRWFYAISGLILLIAPLSILADRALWKYSPDGHKVRRYKKYVPIQSDYYKTNVSKSETDGNVTSSWEEEGIRSTLKNLHSDALLNISALVVFVVVGSKWSYESVASYGWYSPVFSAIVSLWIAGIFLDRSVFSWITYLEQRKQS
jgi:hypothetical protein